MFMLRGAHNAVRMSLRHVGNARFATLNDNVSEIDAIAARMSDPVKPVNVNDASRFVVQYRRRSIEHRYTVIERIATECAVTGNHVQNAMNILKNTDPAHPVNIYTFVTRATGALKPGYSHMFYTISHLNDGVKFLVDLRADVLVSFGQLLSAISVSHKSLLHHYHLREQHAHHLRFMDDHLRNTLSIMFVAGQLNAQRITWQSGADMLEKVGNYEAVHPMSSWSDLRARLGSRRRVFIFTHPSMPREPLVILHVALCPRIEHSIQNVIADQQPHKTMTGGIDEPESNVETLSSDINTALFYSITSVNPGLHGIDLGNQLIKRVVNELRSQVPQVYKFCTLSPMKGFASWLVQILNSNNESQRMSQMLVSHVNEHILNLPSSTPISETCSKLKELLVTRESASAMRVPLEPFLLHMGAVYLCKEKHRGWALDKTANFHIRNGACLWRVNFDGNTSERGWKDSFSLMAHYRYNLERIQTNTEQYVMEKKLDIGYKVQRVLNFSELLQNAK